MSFHRACCCDTEDPVGVLWTLGTRCDNLGGGGPTQTVFPVVRSSWLLDNICLGATVTIKVDGICYLFDQENSSEALIDGEPQPPLVNAEEDEIFCNCWLCEQDIDIEEPTPGNPENGAANCCPNDMGCTTFGSNTIDARVRIRGEITTRTKCSSSPDVFVENSYSFDATLSDDGSACVRSGGAGQDQASNAWDACGGGFSTTPRVSFTANWDGSNGLAGVTARISNLANMPGQASGGEVSHFTIRLRGGNSDFVPNGAGWSSYDVDAYSYNEAVIGACENQFAASGSIELSLPSGNNVVTCSMVVTGALDNLGPCP